ncbi:putative negative acting factor [Diaporthe ampelina]|uniref:Putative negative acting factor n=1 Tax=Diaporthe ampelina TaxID=1214573 RepID=A0A0G2HE83_9PEZI|nr:putative negative acting factor [Diaporthe ampelina]
MASDSDSDLSGVMGLDLQAIHTPLVDRARCYFLSSYVVYCPNKSDTGMLTFIPSLLASAEGSSWYFQDMFSAVSIAAFSMRPNCRTAAAATHLHYGAGVRGLREALEVKESAKSDTVLATTILLGVYEGLAYGDTDKIAYTQHFRAAVELLRLRGPEQFSSKHGTEMFDLVMESLYDLTTVIGDEDIMRWMLDLRSKLASLLGSPRRDSEATRKAVKILMTAQEFERRVSHYYESEDLMAKKNLWLAKPDENADLVYPDWWTATRWLNKYAFRLLICHIIADVSNWLAESTDPWPQNLGTSASQTAKEDIHNIIASIPYLCSWKGIGEDPPKGAKSPCGSDDADSVEGITNLMVIWPLVLAAESQFATPEQKTYVQGRLGWIVQS